MTNLIKIFCFSFLLIGCDSPPETVEPKTVEYYENNDDDRKAMIVECQNSAEHDENIDCNNAITANANLSLNRFLKK